MAETSPRPGLATCPRRAGFAATRRRIAARAAEYEGVAPRRYPARPAASGRWSRRPRSAVRPDRRPCGGPLYRAAAGTRAAASDERDRVITGWPTACTCCPGRGRPGRCVVDQRFVRRARGRRLDHASGSARRSRRPPGIARTPARPVSRSSVMSKYWARANWSLMGWRHCGRRRRWQLVDVEARRRSAGRAADAGDVDAERHHPLADREAAERMHIRSRVAARACAA